MKIRSIIKRSARSLRNAKLRTLLTALAISVGGFTLCLTLAAGNGVRSYTNNLVSSNFDPAELLVGRDKEVSNSGSPSEKPQEYDETITSFQGGGPGSSFQFKQVTRDDIEILESNPRIESVRENFIISIQYITREGQKKYTGSAEGYNPAQRPEIVSGNIPESGDIKKGSILLPDVYLDILGFANAEEAIGQEITVVVEKPFSVNALQQLQSQTNPDGTFNLNNIDPENLEPEQLEIKFKVEAVTKKPVTSLSFGVEPLLISDVDANFIYKYTNEGTTNFDEYLFVYVRVEDGQNKQVRDEVKAELESQGFYVQSAEDIQRTITQFVDILQGIVIALGMVTLLASVFGIVNTQYISVLERTREIGLIKALGMSNKKVLLLFIFEAIWIGFIGGLIGIISGYILGTLLNPVINQQLNLGEGIYLIEYNLLQMFILLVSLMSIAALAGLLPARKASKLDPVEALRTE